MKPKFKPYQLVWATVNDRVEGGHRSFVAEVMSMPMDDTVMVRTVPGHPGTLVELSLDALEEMPRHRNYAYVSYAHIGGSGSFPTDMLRYDQCVPLNFTLVEQGYMIKAVADPKHSLGTDLYVARAVERRNSLHWTTERWRSFLWGCKEVAVLPIGERYTVDLTV